MKKLRSLMICLIVMSMVLFIGTVTHAIKDSTDKFPKTITIGMCPSSLPPYCVDDQTKGPGMLFELLQLMARNLNLDIQFRRAPWKRRLLEMEMNELTGNSFASFKKERMKIGVYPMKDGKPDLNRRTHTVAYYFYKLEDSPFIWDGKEFHNLNGPICAQRGAAIVGLLKQKGVSVVESKAARQCLMKLVKGRVAATVEVGNFADVDLSNEPEQFKGVVKILTPIREKPYYLMLSHKFVKDYPHLAEQIWDEIRKVRESKEYKEIQKKYLGPENK